MVFIQFNHTHFQLSRIKNTTLFMIINEEVVFSMAKDVLCEVNSCKYWGAGNKCLADAIYVVSRKGEHASTSEETDCKTFQPKI